MSKAVVRRAFVGIRQNRVSLAAFFEFFFRVGIVRIAIRMKLQRQLAIGALDLLLVGSAGHPEHFVIVAFYVAGQNGSRSFRLELMLGIARNFDHRGTQQAIFQFVATLQFFEYLMIIGIAGFNHLNGFVKVGIEGLAFSRNGAQAQLLQRTLQLLVDEFDSAAKLGFISRASLQCTFKAVE